MTMKKTLLWGLSALLLLALAAPAPAAQPWQPDAPHTTVAFSIKHIFVHVIGTFDDVKGDIVFDPNRPGQASVDIEIAVESVNTRNDRRDNHLRSPDFFDAAKYPKITFVSDDIRRVEGDRFMAHGTLTIKDVSKEIELPFTFKGMAPSPMKKNVEVAGFESRYTLDRLEYNVGDGRYYDMGVCGREVDLMLFVEALRDK
jgi:polyisoprenoid-binding protein YceI